VKADAPATRLRPPPGAHDGTSERLFRTGLSLPSGSALSDDQFGRVMAAIENFMAGAA